MEPIPFRQVDRDGAIEHFPNLVGGSTHLKPMIETGVDKAILKLLIDENREEQLWVCKSRYIGPLAGHERLGVLSYGELIRYEHLVQY
ncbi:MAG: hypothetical protein ABS75_22705 [Pelagibacterium sp. SCN 63-23]|nr:MAG: hypothetical protein ABS75_22705 [Pelagibacterium sp. SCN 63-23]